MKGEILAVFLTASSVVLSCAQIMSQIIPRPVHLTVNSPIILTGEFNSVVDIGFERRGSGSTLCATYQLDLDDFCATWCVRKVLCFVQEGRLIFRHL